MATVAKSGNISGLSLLVLLIVFFAALNSGQSDYFVICDNGLNRSTIIDGSGEINVDDSPSKVFLQNITIPIYALTNESYACYLEIAIINSSSLELEPDAKCDIVFDVQQTSSIPLHSPSLLRFAHFFEIDNDLISWTDTVLNSTHFATQFLPSCSDETEPEELIDFDISSTELSTNRFEEIYENTFYEYNLSSFVTEFNQSSILPLSFTVFSSSGDMQEESALTLSRMNDTEAESMTCFYSYAFNSLPFNYLLFIHEISDHGVNQSITLDITISRNCTAIPNDMSTTPMYNESMTSTTPMPTNLASMTYTSASPALTDANTTEFETTEESFLDFEIQVEYVISMGVVGLIILLASVVACVCIAKKQKALNNSDLEDQNETEEDEEDLMEMTNRAKTPLGFTEEDHREMLRLAAEHSSSTGLE